MAERKVEDLKILFSEKEIQEKTKELAQRINNDFGAKEDLVLICVLKGSSIFCCDLMRHLKMPVQVEFIRVSSYGNAQASSGAVQAIDLTLPNIEGKNVLIVEDIVDTGCTMEYLTNIITHAHKPKELKLVTILNKKIARKTAVEPDYYGFEIDDKFVVGYGLDYEGYMRNVPFIGYFES